MWALNVWLYLCFFFAPEQYKALVANGSPCYAYVASLGDNQGAQPACWYDPANVNPGR